MGKMLAQVMYNKLLRVIESPRRPLRSQHGFRKTKSTNDIIKLVTNLAVGAIHGKDSGDGPGREKLYLSVPDEATMVGYTDDIPLVVVLKRLERGVPRL